MTLQGCTEAAEALATEQMIRFVDENQILNSIRTGSGQVNPEMLRLLNDKNKYCPKCESMMVLREGRRSGKSFWGCSTYPRCTGKVWIDE
jgi:restriction system protein